MEAENLRVTLDVSVGDLASGARVSVEAASLTPDAAVVLTLHSDPVVLLRGTVGADGSFSAAVVLPDFVEPGRHVLILETTGENGVVLVAGAFEVDDAGRIVNLAQPARVQQADGSIDEALLRALENNLPVYDPNTRPLTTVSLIVAATSLLSLAGASGLGGPTSRFAPSDSSQPERRRSNSRGRLANVVTKKLKALSSENEGPGDRSRTWRLPFTSYTDAATVSLPTAVGRWSAMMPRVIVDGAWLRAMFGSLGLLPWLFAGAVGMFSAQFGSGSVLTPSFAVIAIVTVLGTLDAGAGGVAWIVLVVAALLRGEVTEWADFRTALGLFVLFSSVPLLAHVIRPLRRRLVNDFERVERVIDYVVMPVFVAFAAGSMLKALNGLSGLTIATPGDVSAMRWLVGTAVVVRLACEDVATRLYPARMLAVQPGKFTSPGRTMTVVSVAVRSLVFLIIAEPFFGITTSTVIASLLIALPKVIKMWEDDLPNYPLLNKFLPRGHAQFFVLLLVGSWLSSWLIGSSGDPSAVRSSLIWMMLPGVIFGVAEMFGRHGGDWPNITLKRAVGTVTWLIAVSMTIGWLVPFS